ncbi:MAG: energy-coupling factor transporter ATPase [Clostridiales Family XIII bacterium]|nr:energy-coupling factor transporter ATPase [Clostridiales Family XIII bacterium]
MNNTIINIENLTFEYNGHDVESVKALNKISLEIKKGSKTSIIGRNGSGKSTLAKAINALVLPTEGRVLVAGFDTRDEDRIWDIRKTAGMVFQNPDNQLVSAVVEDDLAFGPENIGVPPEQIRVRIRESLESVDMMEHIKMAPHMLSGGQKQRIAIAGVLAMHPDIIIFDEPTAMLDPEGRHEVMEIAAKLHKEGITILNITHFMEETLDSDRVIILDRGRIALDGTPAEVFSESEKLASLGLKLPFVIELANGLRAKGFDIPQGILDETALMEEICSLGGRHAG